MSEPKYIPCGGCGATWPGQRCIGCMHPFEAATAPPAAHAPMGLAEKLERIETDVRRIAAQRNALLVALEDAHARLVDVARMANGRDEEIYRRAYPGGAARAIAAVRGQ